MAENLDLSLTVEAWADITIKNWLQKILQLKVIDTRALFTSFEFHITKHAGGDPAKIEFAFLYYGKFVDMGAGATKAKRWYNKQFGKEIAKLREILAEKYAEKAAFAVVDAISNPEKV